MLKQQGRRARRRVSLQSRWLRICRSPALGSAGPGWGQGTIWMKGKKDTHPSKPHSCFPRKALLAQKHHKLSHHFFSHILKKTLCPRLLHWHQGYQKLQLLGIMQPRRKHEEVSKLNGLELCPCSCFGLAQAWSCQLLQQICFINSVSSLMRIFMSFNLIFFSICH